MKRILVTGACGYIGSHTMVELLENGYEVISADSHINSNETPLQSIYEITGKKINNCVIDLSNKEECSSFFEQIGHIDGLIHFAALKSVGESVTNPLLYYENNLCSLMNILNAVQTKSIEAFIFSSSCTVYGITEKQPVDETSPFLPTGSPYGRTKQMGEQIIQDVYLNSKLKAISLRYFNPAGAHHSGKLGELPINPALNLVPSITETAIGVRERLDIHGVDYNTRDGSCIRDFIHIEDLASAHRLALEYIFFGKQNKSYEVFNLGTGQGVSVLEAVQSFESIAGIDLNKRIGLKREGDIPFIYSTIEKAQNELGWTPKYGIDDIMSTAWAWEKSRRK